MLSDLVSKIQESGIAVEDTAKDTLEKEAAERAERFAKASSFTRMSPESEEALRKMAEDAGLIPATHRNATFSKDSVKENIVNQQKLMGHKFKVVGFDDYANRVQSIINTIRAGELPKMSYLIGAPNGFGKQSFATDCILASLRNGWVTVPYISLSELAQIKEANDKELLRGVMGSETDLAHQAFDFNAGRYITSSEYNRKFYIASVPNETIKTPKIITGQYSYSEYINAPVLVCFFTGMDSAYLESNTLLTLLSIRSAKGYPTLITLSNSINQYVNLPNIGKYYWYEILTNSEEKTAYDKVFHFSCYKDYTRYIK